MRRSLLYRVMPLFFVVAGMLAIHRLTRRRQYDIIHVHWPLPLALFGWAAQRRRGPPIVTTFYGAELRLGFRRFLAWAARRSARVIAISSYTAAALREIVDVPLDIIPYAAALPPAPPVAARMTDAASVLFVGRLVERKGVVHLVEALAQHVKAHDLQFLRISAVTGEGLPELQEAVWKYLTPIAEAESRANEAEVVARRAAASRDNSAEGESRSNEPEAVARRAGARRDIKK